jgi:hypothetical protein
MARDLAGNATRVRFQFRGSIRRDTVPPTIAAQSPRLYSTKIRKGFTVSFSFSKAIDTLTFGGVLVLPANLKERFTRTWSPSLNALQFSFKDSLGPDTTVSFILFPLLRDFAGNHLPQAGYTSFTSDSLIWPKLVKGRLLTGGAPPKNAIVILEQGAPALAAIGRTDGSFVLRAKDTTYSALAAADTNYDGYVDLIGRTPRAALPETLLVRLEPETLKVRVDSLF